MRVASRCAGRASAASVLSAVLVVILAGSLAGCSRGEETGDGSAGVAGAETKNRVVIETAKGAIEIELYPEQAPGSVENFLTYVDSGYYDGSIFHRVIENFMIQGGGYDADRQRKPTRDPIQNEADNGLKNETGTVSMARTSAPHSATSQFFINAKDNAFLDFQSDENGRTWGYTVFGRVVDGMDVVRVIEQTPTSDEGGAFRDLPEETVVIETIRRK